MSRPVSPERQRADYLDAQLWVTPHRTDEMYPSGEYLSRATGGLRVWTRENRAVADTDVVVWYVLGITHLPRAEDYPFMPVHRAGFMLLPTSFFTRNPALDVDRPARGPRVTAPRR
jgi:primary-amine oxidase